MGEQWTALGFSPDGDMLDSDAVIYRPEEDDVSEYLLNSQVRQDRRVAGVKERQREGERRTCDTEQLGAVRCCCA